MATEAFAWLMFHVLGNEGFWSEIFESSGQRVLFEPIR